ncbi:MAG: helix-turn-helix domain-containing protein [Deltaproteobacteria bacterium]|jgi:HTH-type transcriptional regulator / antitoxin HigA|nr:helix-turn-helix domain-containing protein [Candidatus Latescibacterota bacterium]MBT7155377.1 helix-turn-helix domain-containing protein [Deltaproteobacteria bacterium]
MKNQILTAIQSNWPPIAEILTYPKNDKEYAYKLELMNELLNLDLPDEHPVSSFIDLLGDLIDEYEKSNFEEVQNLEKINISSIEKIKHLMNEYNLKQKDLIDIMGSQGYVSDVLNGKRDLSLKHIRGLAEKFNINAKSLV